MGTMCQPPRCPLTAAAPSDPDHQLQPPRRGRAARRSAGVEVGRPRAAAFLMPVLWGPGESAPTDAPEGQ